MGAPAAPDPIIQELMDIFQNPEGQPAGEAGRAMADSTPGQRLSARSDAWPVFGAGPGAGR